ncbi:MAG: three-Cys-motif partner protein TcmP [Anaerolineae bacterium]|nr:three-Cys-motif partner protein TcmP [Anaerolineae bacterium]
MQTHNFFDESKEQSEIKAAIVSKYFWAWATVMTRQARANKIAYIDLFAGRGRYKNETKSTPLLILEKAIQDDKMRNKLVTIFNDKNEDNSKSLENAINSLPGINTLKYRPQVYNFEVGDQIVKKFQQMKLVPTLFFVDPWGYKGLSLNLIGSVLKDWGCDCIFFFNYNRINMGLSNDAVRQHMGALFGQIRAEALRIKLEPLKPYERELTIVEELAQALKKMGGEYVLPFRFRDDRGHRTSHHLIFVSKNVLGYTIMKDIMASQSSRTEQGVPSFEYNPADKRYTLLFEFSRPLDDLAETLLVEFAGQRLSLEEVFQKHQVGRPYVKKNYQDVLKQLEQEGRIETDPPAEARRKNTFADRVMISFPKK